MHSHEECRNERKKWIGDWFGFNRALEVSKYRSVLVVPLTTQEIQTEYKIEIPPRDRLEKRSFILANRLCTLGLKRIQIDKGVITKLQPDELQALKAKVCDLM